MTFWTYMEYRVMEGFLDLGVILFLACAAGIGYIVYKSLKHGKNL